MRRPLVVLAAALSLGGCARYVPDVRDQEKVAAGKIARIAPRVAPEDEVISWDPGDGTRPVIGPELRHAWQRAGRYTVRASSSGGSRTFTVEVVPRAPLGAVPADARMALVMPEGFRKLPRLAELAGRMSAGGEAKLELTRFEERIGIDLDDPGSAVAQGIDPAEGFAVVKLVDDPDSTWMLVGTLDDELAMALGRKILEAGEPERRETEVGPFALALDAQGRQVAWGVGGGYLALRMPSLIPRADLPQLFTKLVQQPAGDLSADPAYQRGRAHAPGDDGVFFVRTDRVRLPGGGAEAQAAVVGGLTLRDDELSATFFAPLDEQQAQALGKASRSPLPPQNLAAGLPDGAVAFLGLSLDPKALAAEMLRKPQDRAAIELFTGSKLGLSLDELLGIFSGQVAVAIYLDAEGALRSFGRSEERGLSSEDIPPTVGLMGLTDARAAPARLLALLKQVGGRPAGKGLEVGPSLFVVNGAVLAGATGVAQRLLGKPGTGALLDAVGADVLATPGATVFYLDLGALHEGLSKAQLPKDLTPAERARLAEQQAQLEALRPFRDLLIHASGTSGGVAGGIRLRLRPAPAVAVRPPGGEATKG